MLFVHIIIYINYSFVQYFNFKFHIGTSVFGDHCTFSCVSIIYAANVAHALQLIHLHVVLLYIYIVYIITYFVHRTPRVQGGLSSPRIKIDRHCRVRKHNRTKSEKLNLYYNEFQCLRYVHFTYFYTIEFITNGAVVDALIRVFMRIVSYAIIQ